MSGLKRNFPKEGCKKMSKLKSFGIFALGMSFGIGFCIVAGKYRRKLNEKSKKTHSFRIEEAKEETKKQTWGDLLKGFGIDLDKIVEENITGDLTS